MFRMVYFYTLCFVGLQLYRNVCKVLELHFSLFLIQNCSNLKIGFCFCDWSVIHVYNSAAIVIA